MVSGELEQKLLCTERSLEGSELLLDGAQLLKRAVRRDIKKAEGLYLVAFSVKTKKLEMRKLVEFTKCFTFKTN